MTIVLLTIIIVTLWYMYWKLCDIREIVNGQDKPFLYSAEGKDWPPKKSKKGQK